MAKTYRVYKEDGKDMIEVSEGVSSKHDRRKLIKERVAVLERIRTGKIGFERRRDKLLARKTELDEILAQFGS